MLVTYLPRFLSSTVQHFNNVPKMLFASPFSRVMPMVLVQSSASRALPTLAIGGFIHYASKLPSQPVSFCARSQSRLRMDVPCLSNATLACDARFRASRSQRSNIPDHSCVRSLQGPVPQYYSHLNAIGHLTQWQYLIYSLIVEDPLFAIPSQDLFRCDLPLAICLSCVPVWKDICL